MPDKEQIATKTELQQATAYLATLDNATMAPQSATVKRETDNLQAQINNIVRAPESGGDVAAEVYQARIGADGTSYQTLKDRLDSEKSSVDSEVQELAERSAAQITHGKNIFDLYTPVLNDKVWRGNSVEVADKPGYSCFSRLFKYTGDSSTKQLRFNQKMYKIVLYDSSGTTIIDYSESSTYIYAIDIPDDATIGYFSASFKTSDVDTNSLVIINSSEVKSTTTNTITDYIKPYQVNDEIVDIPELTTLSRTVSQQAATMESYRYEIDEYGNLFDYSEVTHNSTTRDTGEVVEKQGYTLSDYIKIPDGCTKLRTNSLYYKCTGYDSNKNFVSGALYSSKFGIPISADVKYVRITWADSATSYDSLMVLMTNDSLADTVNTISGMEYIPVRYSFYDVAQNRKEIAEIKDTMFVKRGIDNAEFMRENSTLILTDSVTGEQYVKFTGGSNWRTQWRKWDTCNPNEIIILEFYGKSSHPEYSLTTGATFVVEFFSEHSELTKIGNSYNSYVLGENRRGYHRYGFVVPLGATYYRVRLDTHTNTDAEISRFNLRFVNEIPHRNNGVIFDGHQGMINYAPKNTIPAIEMSRLLSFNTCIINLKKTSDGVLVVLHDQTINATSDGEGDVSSYTYAELLEYDFGSWFNIAYSDTKIPTVEQALQAMAVYGIMPAFSCHGDWASAVEERESVFLQILNLVRKCGFRKICIKAFDSTYLDTALAIFGDIAEYIWDISDFTAETVAYAQQFGEILLLKEIPITSRRRVVIYAWQVTLKCRYGWKTI